MAGKTPGPEKKFLKRKVIQVGIEESRYDRVGLLLKEKHMTFSTLLSDACDRFEMQCASENAKDSNDEIMIIPIKRVDDAYSLLQLLMKNARLKQNFHIIDKIVKDLELLVKFGKGLKVPTLDKKNSPFREISNEERDLFR